MELYGTELHHCSEQVKELETSEFNKSVSEIFWEYRASENEKLCLSLFGRNMGNKLCLYSFVTLELDGSGQLHATADLSPGKKLSFPKCWAG
jgi:hypothetical protein